ncbi:hypothetical protein EMIHUDRAFT_234846 [Emiliania huxleyi CCMP1516]|uniref:V-SNARE coiled-coil homology domain-containing protein n=2 Tax=Emiliania huxleyi TaxID=2903 RepID=A0A0D3JXM0_EMIH1|nr:hypothetical protein EMIHUDRAFT_234846 [Emiliania huxleyi CCMP1516]EOD28255.1 hypothetical protein EMIHUDRAFT_234846 [Emiliania huxleyi CCMP1516]|eukprot:XP_005780684.1 hypothetical protein EMIHUDRAFT_234846 [Emiliania huxleyi CCMP1516]
MYVVGGTIREMEPDGLVQLRGGGLRERAMAGAAASAMNESLSAAQERGEKLAQVGDKAENLAHEADEFASLAKQLRRQQEGGFFGGLFG